MSTKQGIVAMVVLGLWISAANAVDLNTDALKKMQQEGHKIVEEQGALLTLRLANGNCLAAAGKPGQVGANLVVQKCDDNASAQKWQFDQQGRLVSHGGTCVGIAGNASKHGSNAQLQECAGNPQQKWSHDKQGRLAGHKGLCLQATGGNVMAANCGKSPSQKWR